jgi:N-acetylneuraminate synthase
MGFEIGRRVIGSGSPTYIIAEISANHRQDYEQAAELVRAAHLAGADAVKLQTYRPETITIDCNNEFFHIGEGTIWSGKTLFELYAEAYMPWEWQPGLKLLADSLDIDLFSTPFDHTAVDFLDSMAVPAFKIASFELVDIPLLRRVAASKKPIIMSTGMATLSEIEEAITTIREAGGEDLALLKCTSSYPASPSEINLRTIPHLSQAFDLPVGLSDHTLGISVPTAAVALGACIVEKHITLSRAAGGPDSSFSLEPNEFAQMVEAVRTAKQALGSVRYRPTAKEVESRIFRRSLFVVEDVNQGDIFTEVNVRSVRPGNGLHTRYIDRVIGHAAASDIERGTPLRWTHVGRKLSG